MPFPKPLLSSPTAGRSASLVFIAITVCLDAVAQSISFPVLPRLAEHLLGGDRPAAARWFGILEVGWVIPQMFAAPVLGMLSDRFGRRPVVLLSVFGIGLELIMQALAPTVGWLLLARVLCGLTCGGQAAAMAYVADITPPALRTRRFGWLNASIWTGIVIGPAAGGLLAMAGIRAPFWAAAGFALAGALYGFFVLPESLPARGRAPIRWAKANPLAALGLIVTRPGLLVLGAVMLLLWFAMYADQTVIVLYTAFRYGWTPVDFGLFCSVLAVGNIAAQSSLAGRVAQRIGERRTIVAGLVMQTAGLAAMGLAPTGALFWAASLPQVFGNIAGPALQSLMTARVGADEQGRLQGAIGAIGSLTGLSGPVAFAQVFAWSIAAGHAAAWSGSSLLIGSGISLAACVLVALTARAARAIPPPTPAPDPAGAA